MSRHRGRTLATLAATVGLASALAGCGPSGPARPVGPGAGSPKFAKAPEPMPLPESATVKAPEPPTLAALHAMGDEALGVGNIPRAIEIYEEAVRVAPDDLDALLRLGGVTQRQASRLPEGRIKHKLLRRSAEVLRRATRLGRPIADGPKPLIAEAFFNEARLNAIDGQAEAAVGSLRDALALGYDDAEAIEAEAAFRTIRDRPEYPSLVGSAGLALKAHALDGLARFSTFPFAFDLRDLDGRRVKLADYAGRVTIVDFWGTWCPPCRREIPHFVTLLDRHRGDGLAVVGINEEKVPREEWVDTIRAFLRTQAVPYPCLLGDEATTARVPGFAAYPTTLFVDRAGRVRYRTDGYVPLARLEVVVKALLDERPATGSPGPKGPL